MHRGRLIRTDTPDALRRQFEYDCYQVEGPRLREYNAWFAQDDWDAVSVPFKAVADAGAIVSAFRELPVSGWHLHGTDLQASVLDALDDLAPAAARQNKVNGIVRRKDGSLVGHWVESPREQYDVWRSDD